MKGHNKPRSIETTSGMPNIVYANGSTLPPSNLTPNVDPTDLSF